MSEDFSVESLDVLMVDNSAMTLAESSADKTVYYLAALMEV